MIHKLKSACVILFLSLIIIIPMSGLEKAQAATLRISSSSFTIEVNHYKTLYVSGTSRRVTWSSSNKAVAYVSSTGKVTGKSPGTAIIYASVAGKKLSCKVSVVKLNQTTTYLEAGTVKTLKAYPAASKVSWSSNNKAVATVSTTGKVTAKAPGKATIYAVISGKKLSCTVTVLKLSSKTATMTVGSTKALKVITTLAKVAWSSSDSKVAVVKSNGVVTARGSGTATIKATVSGITLSCKITVKSPDITINSMDQSMIPADHSISYPAKNIIGYYAAWSRYSGFTPDKIDAKKLTHINYAFANIGSDLKIQLGFPDIDPSNIKGLNQLKLINPNIKTIISVGGWSWSGRFSDAALTDASRTTFADSCVDFIVKYGFDGVDIDWEYPVVGGLATNVRRPEDKANFTLLLRKLREKLNNREVLDGKKYILTFAGAAGGWYTKNIELSQISQYVDYANVMTYDLHGTWDTYTNFNAPLYSNDPLHPEYISVDRCIRSWQSSGFPKEKIVMGVPFYGYIYQSVTDLNYGYNQTYSGGASISYSKITANYLNAAGYRQYFDPYSRVPWLFNGSTFITYENEQSVAEKAAYVKNHGLGGIMIWQISQDPNKILLNALYQELNQ